MTIHYSEMNATDFHLNIDVCTHARFYEDQAWPDRREFTRRMHGRHPPLGLEGPGSPT
jgi:hypothetical protein